LGVKELEAGSQLIGYLKLNKELKGELRPKFRSNGQRGSASATVPIVCGIASHPKGAESRDKLPEIKEEEKKDESQSESAPLEEKRRDALIDWINKKLKGTEQQKAFELFGGELTEKYPHHLPLLLLKLEIAQNAKEGTKRVMEAADEILDSIDLQEMAAFFGKKVKDKKSEKNKKYKEQKNAVIDALRAKLCAMKDDLSAVKGAAKVNGDSGGSGATGGAKQLLPGRARVPKENLKAFEAVYEALGEWVDVEKDKKCFEVNVWYHLQRGLVAKVLAMINEKMSANAKDDKAPNKEHLEMKSKLFRECLPTQQFAFLVDQIRMDLAKKFPAEYRPF